MSTTKILHITQSLGGVKTYLENIFEYSDPQKFKFIVIAPSHTEFQQFCHEKEIKYYPINIQRSINPFKDFVTFLTLIKYIRKEKPNVVHTHSAKGGFLGRLAAKTCSTKVVYTPHAFSYLSFTGIKRVIFYLLEYIAKGWTDLLLSVSYSEANRAHFDLGYNKNQVNLFINSVLVRDVDKRVDYSGNVNIGMIGRLTYQKNPLLFLEIAARLIKKYPQLKFSILGAGLHDHLIKEINESIKNNDLSRNLQILAWGDNNTSREFLLNTDIFVMTSVFEGLPYSLLEAMEKGIPCVVSNVDGNLDVVQNKENGFVCLTVDGFCEKIESLIISEELRRRIGQAGFEYLNCKHNIKTNISVIESIYDRLAEHKVVECNNNYKYLYH